MASTPTAITMALRRRGLLSASSFATKQSRIGLMVQRTKSSSSAFADIPVPESVRDAVKDSLLEEAAKADSKFWSSKRVNGATMPTNGAVPYHHDQQQKEQQRRGQQQQHLEQKHKAEQGGVGSADNDGIQNDMSGDVMASESRIGQTNNTNMYTNQTTIHEATTYGLEEDPLDEWYWDRELKYWPELPPSVALHADPFELSQNDLDTLDRSIREDLIGTDHPVLNMAASYFFQPNVDGGKKVRPRMVLLLSKALLCHTQESNDLSIQQRTDLADAQRRLAEISELIHTASLFHDDVIDEAETRRGNPAVHQVFGNKVAILAGDYLLARASIGLARLRQVDVVECMSTIIEHLVRGEVMQMNKTAAAEVSSTKQRLEYYLKKNYYKTGSLMANSCQSAAMLGNYPKTFVDAAYRYGKHLGLAFQLVDDVLDFEGSLKSMGKPALSDLNAGLATAPVLFAAEEFPEHLNPLIERKFKQDGDVDEAVKWVLNSKGMEKTKELAQTHAELAMEAVLDLKPSAYRDALVHLAYKVVDRTR